MLQKVIMPKLGDTMEEGIIVNRRIKEGDTVNKGDIIMEVENDKETPIVDNGKVKPAMIMKLTLSVDHRFTGGVYAARFLSVIKDCLENPEQIFT